jgi:deoxyribodipyrimidine photolyase-related protein
MLAGNWHLAHSLLSPYLNLGLLLPGEVCDRVEAAYRAGAVPLNSAEGMIRQVIGWREFVWGVYWLRPDQWDANVLGNDRQLPPSWTGSAATDMRCVATTIEGLERRGWVHHIQRLMILSNFANLYGVVPARVRDWMRERYVDGAEWVMGPNVMGMGMWADGGLMSTKPYVSGGGYIDRMSDYCGDCRFDPRKRTGDDACPFTTLYWDFLDRHREQLSGNARMARQYHTLDRLRDMEGVRARAGEVREAIAAGLL